MIIAKLKGGPMKDFSLNPKTHVIFGKNALDQTPHVVGEYGKRVLLHYDAGDFIKPLVKRVRELLEKENIEVFELGGVQPNPRYDLVLKGIEICRNEAIDVVLAIGGGSVMDSSKFIAFGVHADYEPWDYQSFSPIHHEILPHGAISTLPGTGSELSGASMILREFEDGRKEKHQFMHPDLRFDFAIINPELAFTLPLKQTAAGSFDIISHSLEGYFTKTENTYLMDGYYEAIIKTVFKNARIVRDEPDNYDARANLWIASLMPMEHYLIMGTQPDWVVHNIEKPLTSMYNLTHGEMLGILTLAWLRYEHKKPNRTQLFEKWAVQIMGVAPDYHNRFRTIEAGIEKLENWLKSMQMPTRLYERDIDESRFEEAAELALKVAGFEGRNGTIGMNSKLTFDEIIQIYHIAMED